MKHPFKTLKLMLMNYIIENVREANNVEFRRHYKFMINIHKSVMLALLETKMTDRKSLDDELEFYCQIQYTASGAS